MGDIALKRALRAPTKRILRGQRLEREFRRLTVELGKRDPSALVLLRDVARKIVPGVFKIPED